MFIIYNKNIKRPTRFVSKKGMKLKMGISIEEYKKLQEKSKNKNPYRQIKGRTSHFLGEAFENRITSICNFYERNDLAKIEKTPEPMKILQHIDNGHFETIFTKAAQPDFKGCIKGGRTVVFDAKFTEADRITYQVLSNYQRETLLKYKSLGAMAFVVIGFSNGEIYKVDINTWDNMKENFGRKYILQTELEEKMFKVPKTKNGIIDFLELC